ncbi:RagB/SusD family nutrient uptake outer membrane protein [Chitinophaga vietnamensis]|uniref:RagB/SusD family nutrient uptake outer membrane protein n=1 Tax=Chitinophaga vietnamensis TaxID=2593957 RepID=UPI00191BCB47|nr:RagB/SusD family nutrient uptake outer membrane protein [Chitinophaga vietnamensis]
MKKISIYATLILLGSAIASCNKDFLQRLPQTSITPEAFFNTPKDLETYSNSFYDNPVYATDDINSDNISSYSGGGELDIMVHNGLNSTTVGTSGWDDWNKLRSYNFMLDNVAKTKGDPAAINHFIGIARFFRARFYMAKVARYSDVPWYSHAMSNTDSSLYAPRDPRTKVVDSIMADLQFAVDNIMPDEGNRTRVSKWTALALMARFGVFEGTFRKYHDELNLQSSANTYLQKAAWACEQLMGSGKFKIYSTGNGAQDYRSLFSSLTLSGNPEMIQWVDYQQALGIGNNTHAVLGWMWSLSQSLVYSYLMKDGTPFTSQPGYDKMDFVKTFQNRDPRLAETVAYPGYSTTNDKSLYIPKPNLGAYDQLKFFPRDPAQRQGWGADYSGIPVYRYAEVLLNYAEAKAELGTLTQSDVDNTINQLRLRVQMPPLNMAAANALPDPVQAAAYPNVSGVNKGVLLEIRRERRVEMACEGLRFNDVNRWKAGMRFQDAQQGMYVAQLGGIDMSGDGVADIAILASPTDTAALAGLPANVRASVSRFYLKDKDGKDNNFYLENNTSGHIMFTANRDVPRKFEEPKYYYRPVPLAQTVLNPNLKQLFGWQ